MTPAAHQLTSLYQTAQKYYQAAARTPDEAKWLHAANELAQRFYHLFTHQPKLMLAQYSCPPQGFAAISYQAMHQATAILAMAEQAKWPEAVQIDVVGCALYALTGIADSTDETSLNNPFLQTLKSRQSLLQQHPWFACLASCVRYLQGQPSWRLDPYAIVLCTSYRLVFTLTTTKSNQLRQFETLFHRLWYNSDHTAHRFLQLLAQQGAALYQLGRFCTDSIGAVAFITSAEPQLAGYQFDLSMKSLSAEQQSIAGSSMQLLAPRYCKDISWLELLWNSDTKSAESDLAALKLQSINQLNPQWSISKQVQFLDAYPEFSAVLQKLASGFTRQHLVIKDTRHALALMGTDSLPLRLKHAWLLQQSQRCVHPWHRWFDGFASVFTHALQLLSADGKNSRLQPLEAPLIAASLQLQLEQHPQLRHQTLAPLPKQTDYLARRCSLLLWQDSQLLSATAQQVHACGLPLLWQDAFLQLRQSTDLASSYSQQQSANSLLKFALVLTELYYCGHSSWSAQLDDLYRHVRHAIDLPSVPWQYWLHELQSRYAAHWPLQADL